MSRIVVITGGTAGVGRATARRFAASGADVAVIARDVEGLEATAAEIEDAGCRALPLQVDVADGHAVAAAADKVEQELGPIDVWVNNAMVTVFGPVRSLELAEVERVTAVTYLGTVNGTLAALERMRARDRGTIVQVGSALAYRSIPLQAPYCAAKHAIVGFTDSLRTELMHDGSSVHVTTVHLPAMNTPQFEWCRTHMTHDSQPVPPIYQPEVAADAIEWASRHRRRELWVGYSTVLTILGQRIAPALLDRYLARTGYESQLTDTKTPPGRPDNLFTAVPGDHGAHGPFSARARRWSPQTRLAEWKGVVAGLATVAAVRLSRRN